MKSIITIILPILLLTNCHVDKRSKLIGKWKEYATEVNGETKITDDGYPKFFIISKEKNELSIVKDYGGTFSADSCDNVLFDGTELTFRKTNESGNYNYYKLALNEENDMLIGEERSYNGNTYKIKCKKVVDK